MWLQLLTRLPFTTTETRLPTVHFTARPPIGHHSDPAALRSAAARAER